MGTYTVDASFPGSTDYTAATAAVTFTISQATPTVTAADPGGTYNGSPCPATAAVSGGSSLEGVSPAATYYVGSSPSGSGSSAAPVAAGIYTVVAAFPGSADYAAASSAPAAFTISPALTTTTLTVSQNPSTYGQASLTATVMFNQGAGVVSAGMVEFVNATTTAELGEAAISSTGVVTLSPIPAGSYPVVADYLGSSNFAASSSCGPIGPNSTITTVAGGGTLGNGSPATAAYLYKPDPIAVDAAGDLFIAGIDDNKVFEVNHSTGVIATVAGDGDLGFGGDGGPATAAR